jgi:hypothetical protein
MKRLWRLLSVLWLALRLWRKPWQPAPPLDDTYSPFADIDLATAFVVARGLL